MSRFLDRLPILLEEAEEDLPLLRENAAKADKDKSGSSSNVLSNVLRFLGVAEFVANANVEKFIKSLREAAYIRLGLIVRFDEGEPISESYVSMISYKSLLNALASGDFGLAVSLAGVMGGRGEIEKNNDHPFDIALGYALRSMVLNADDQVEKLAQLKAVLNEPENKDFVGYSKSLEAILNGNVEQFVIALQEVLLGHNNQCKGNGVFKNSEDEVLCVWGLGVTNLARSKGMNVQFDDPLLPASLMV